MGCPGGDHPSLHSLSGTAIVSDLTPALAMAPEKEAISVLKRQSEQMYIKAISLLLVHIKRRHLAERSMTSR